jgi:glycosyltransferase involved in cell wall biosynthesis
VRVLRFARRLGAADALATGFDRARGDIAITIPAYFDADPAGLGALCAALENGADMAFAVRTGHSDGLVKPLQTTLFSRLSSWATGTHFNDVGSATRALRLEIVRDLPLYGEFHHFLPVIALHWLPVVSRRGIRARAPRVYQLRVISPPPDILSMSSRAITRRPRDCSRGGMAFRSAGP